MTAAHVHAWHPIAELAGRYSCDCGATGYRAINGERAGQIVEHRQRARSREATTVRLVGSPGGGIGLGNRRTPHRSHR